MLLITLRNMAFLLRFLQSVKFDNEAALKSINDYIDWRAKRFPIKVNKALADLIVTIV